MDAIFAVSTPPGRSDRAMLRVSGEDLKPLMARIFSSAPHPRRLAPARLGLQGVLGLPVLAAYFPVPRSYTGEDMLEIQAAGNPLLVERISERLLALPGVRQAEPGEFTARAYLAGRMDLARAEGVAARIAAANEAQLRAADRLGSGEAGAALVAMADELAELLALVEAGIDFTDQEDVVAISPSELRDRLGAVLARMEAELGPASGERAAEAPLVVLAGAPNAGKSTLFNSMLGRERAVAGDLAGTTRDALIEPLDLCDAAPGAGCVRLADLPGLDAVARGEADRSAQSRALAALQGADVVVHCDPTGRFPPLQMAAAPVIRVRTKADLPGVGGGLAVCALDGWHLDVLKRAIADAVGGLEGDALPSRYRRALTDARDRTREAIALAGDSMDAELVADALRAALDCLGELLGRIEPDEILGRVFSSFCIGK